MAARKKYDFTDVYKNFITADKADGINEGEEQGEEKGEVLIQRSYYLTPELVKAITLKTADSSLNKSAVVREALKVYLADILEKMEKEGQK